MVSFFLFSKMAAAVILKVFEILTVGTVSIVELRHLAKFHRNRSNRGRDLAIFRFFQDDVRRHLRFSKYGNFRGGNGQNTLLCQISRRLVKPLLTYGDFSIVQNGGHRRLAFLILQIFNHRDAQEG